MYMNKTVKSKYTLSIYLQHSHNNGNLYYHFTNKMWLPITINLSSFTNRKVAENKKHVNDNRN